MRGTNGLLSLVLVVGAALVVPWVINDYWLLVTNRALITIVAAVGLSILSGTTGQLSVAQGAFMAIGAYTAAITSLELGLPFVPATLAAVGVAVAVGIAIGYPVLRLDSMYLAVATLAFHTALMFQIRRLDFTGGSIGLRLPSTHVLGWHLDRRIDFYFLLLPVTAACVAAAHQLLRSRTGRALRGIRERDLAAAALGVDVTRFKLLAFALCAACGAIAGSIDAFAAPTITPDSYPLTLSIKLLTIVIVGGMGSLGGVVVAAAALSLLPEAIRMLTTALDGFAPRLGEQVLAVQVGAYGIVLVLVLTLQPRGLAGWWASYRARRDPGAQPGKRAVSQSDELVGSSPTTLEES